MFIVTSPETISNLTNYLINNVANFFQNTVFSESNLKYTFYISKYYFSNYNSNPLSKELFNYLKELPGYSLLGGAYTVRPILYNNFNWLYNILGNPSLLLPPFGYFFYNNVLTVFSNTSSNSYTNDNERSES